MLCQLQLTLCSRFSVPSALKRAKGTDIPSKVYRYHHENCGTLSKTMSRTKQKNHKDVPGLELKESNAFQSVGTLKANQDFTKESFAKHFIGNMTREPTPFISQSLL
jgi:hypothetical protein